MTVLKQYNTGTSTWETVVVGQPGEAGIVNGAVAPADTSVLWLDTADTASQVAVPSGGTAGQILAKTSGTDYATGWTDLAANRNVIINGSMEIAQRGASNTFGSGGGTRYYAADRWFTENYQWSSGSNITTSNDSSVYPTGFTNSVKVATGSTGLTFASGASLYMRTNIEGYDMVPLYSQPTATLSFWVRSSVTGTYSILFDNSWWGSGATTRGLLKEYTVNSANTWEKKTIVIDMASALSAGTWNKTNGIGLGIQFNLGAHSDRIGNTYLNSWANWSTYLVQSSSSVNWATNANATFYLAGVQLEPGSAATPFKRNTENIQQELAACQRYYYRISSGASNLYQQFGTGVAQASNNAYVHIVNPVTMRAVPTSIEYSGGSNPLALYNSSFYGVTAMGFDIAGPSGVTVFCSTSGLSTNSPYRLITNASSTGYIGISAEL